MFKHTTRLTLAVLALLVLTSSATRQPRSIWPWSSPTTEEPLISEKHAEILRQSGYGELLDLSKHPVWKIHKYEGIDLKPVQVESEVIKSQPQLLPELDARNPVSSAPVTESDSTETTEEADLSFLDNLGGLAYFLPDAEDEEEEEKADVLAGAIANEEQSHPGFFSKLWSKLWGSSADDSQNDVSAEQIDDDSALVQIALPATKENYAEITLVQPTTRGAAQVAVQPPPVHQATQYAFTASGVGSEPTVTAKPVAKWYRPNDQFSRSQAWVQSWNPSAAYSVHVEGPSEHPEEHVAMVHAYTADASNHFQRKFSDNEEVVVEQKSATPVEEEKSVDVQDAASQTSVSANEEKVAEARNVPEISPEKEKEEEVAQASTDSPKTTSEDEKLPANHAPEATTPKQQQPQEVVVVVAEGQGQQVAASPRLESSGRRMSSLRQKTVKALKNKIVPQNFIDKMHISEKEIDDFINNREGSNATWEKIRIHMQQLGPIFPAVRRMFLV